jgi:hypothetical protein
MTAEELNAKIVEAIAAVRCDGATPVGSFLPLIADYGITQFAAGKLEGLRDAKALLEQATKRDG